jgi:multiple sugar transport system substrate-binding protein
MRGTRRAAALLAGVVAAAAFAGCSSGSAPSGGGEAKGTDSATGTISFLAPEYSDQTEGYWRSLIKDFEAKYPGAKVQLQMVSWTDINQKITTLVSTGKPPDILNLDTYSNFARDKLLLPADEVISPQTQANFIEKYAENGQYNGTQYGIPISGSSRSLFYNKALFKKAGISQPPKTWDDLLADAKKIKDATGKPGYGMPMGPEEAQAEFSLFAFGNGGGWKQGDTWTIDSPANVQALQFMNKLNDAGVTQPNPASTNRTDLWKVFGAGNIGMVEGSSFYPVLLKEQNPKLEYGIAPVPVPAGKPPVTLAVEDYMMVFNTTEHAGVAKRFLDFYYSKANYSKFIDVHGFLPALKDVAAEVAQKNPQQKVFIDSIDTAKFYPAGDPAWGAIAPKVKQNLGTAVGGGAKPEDVLKDLQQQAEQGGD